MKSRYANGYLLTKRELPSDRDVVSSVHHNHFCHQVIEEAEKKSTQLAQMVVETSSWSSKVDIVDIINFVCPQRGMKLYAESFL